jgi:tetratricopeptide (TPR) repeat protein
MLEVPPFTPAEGAALLAAAGGDWLPEQERRDLVRAVDGHALATGVLAGLLAARTPAADLAGLRADLASATRTDARVGRVLEFYSARLSEQDRYLLAAVSLFARPARPEGVLAVAGHEVFGGRLAGWTLTMVEAAVRGRLGGLVSWHPDGTISAHPLVRDAFRPLVLDAAEAAADTALAGLPAGKVGSRADALRVVEVLELLLDAGQWQPADDLYASRCGGRVAVWLSLPAARLGQRAAAAFVATPARRAACAARLSSASLNYYLNAAGLFAMYAGDLATARQYLPEAIGQYRDAGDPVNLAIGLQNLAECLVMLGQPGPAQDAATEALTCAQTTGSWERTCSAHAYLGWAAALAADTALADQQFTAANQIHVTNDPDGDHLYSRRGVSWADWLARTGRSAPARALTTRNAEICRRNGWNDDTARCNRVLGALALAAGDTTAAGTQLGAAAGAFRDGDFLPELADTLPALAAWAQASGDLDSADLYLTEALAIAAPRGLVPTQAAALAGRARLHAAHAAASGPGLLPQGRDAADAALRLAAYHHLPWQELDALRAHADLDQAEGADHGWAAKARAVHARLVPQGLDPDPLTTVERLAGGRKRRQRRPRQG